MRLIDADALYEYSFPICDGYDEAEEVDDVVSIIDINNAPTIDAVEVVRCKDCKHRYGDDCPMHSVERDTIDWYERDYSVVDNTQDDGFCYMWQRERKEP